MEETYELAEKFQIDLALEELESSSEETVCNALKMLSEQLFIPWLNKQKQQNKQYFASKDGVKKIIKVLNEAASIPVKIDAGTALWNFGEKEENMEVLANENAIDPMIEFLRSNFQEMQITGLGFVNAFLEYDTKAYLTTNYDRRIISDIMTIIKKTKSEEIKSISCLTCYFLSRNAHTRSIFCSLGGVDILLDASNQILDNFHLTLGLAHVMNDEKIRIKKKQKKDGINKLSSLIKLYVPMEIGMILKNVGETFTNLKPFVELPLSTEPNVSLFGLHALSSIILSDSLKDQLKSNTKLLDKVVCLQWHRDTRAKKYTDSIIQALGDYSVPSLLIICKFQIQTKYPNLIKRMLKLKHKLL